MRLRLVPAILAVGLLLAACGPTAEVLYYWGGTHQGVTEYERYAYRSASKQSPESTCAMLMMYESLSVFALHSMPGLSTAVMLDNKSIFYILRKTCTNKPFTLIAKIFSNNGNRSHNCKPLSCKEI